MAPKRHQEGDSIRCMIEDTRIPCKDALKITDPPPLSKDVNPSKILVALQLIPDLTVPRILQTFEKPILNEHLFEALMELPMHMRKAWLLLLPWSYDSCVLLNFLELCTVWCVMIPWTMYYCLSKLFGLLHLELCTMYCSTSTYFNNCDVTFGTMCRWEFETYVWYCVGVK